MGVDGKVFVVSSGELLVISEMILSLIARMTVPLMVPLPLIVPLKVALMVPLMVPLMVLMMSFAIMASILIPSPPQMLSFVRHKMHILPKITFIHRTVCF